MKQFLKNVFTSLIAGIVFIATVILFALTYDHFFAKSDKSKQDTWIESPTGITIIEHNKAENTTFFTINGVFENTSDESYMSVHVETELWADSARINSCKDFVNHVEPKSRRAFQIECSGVSGINLPDNVRYTIKIDGAWEYSGNVD